MDMTAKITARNKADPKQPATVVELKESLTTKYSAVTK
jgi:hypothetical protein